MLLVATTIRLSAFTRRRETGIMRLVGASNLFIQLPFILESMIAAALGACLACLALVPVVQYVIRDWLATKLSLHRPLGGHDTRCIWAHRTTRC